MNTIAYAIYLAITYLITVKVGWRFYRNGRIFILGLLEQNHTLADAINNILLVGYYLVNLGYATVMISSWGTIHSWTEMLLPAECGLCLLDHENCGNHFQPAFHDGSPEWQDRRLLHLAGHHVVP